MPSVISGGLIALVLVLVVFCLATLALHLHAGKDAGHGYFKVKVGFFTFEYGTPPKPEESDDPGNAEKPQKRPSS